VVEAYWIGNEYLELVEASPFYESLKERFRLRMDARAFAWMTSELEHGARPHHNVHVFDVYRRAGLMRDGHATIALDRMDRCRISWGRVTAVDGAELVVDRQPLVLIDGKLALADAASTRVTRQIGGRGFADGDHPGDVVAIHWDWIYEVLSLASLERLMRNTRRAIDRANATL
jgi:Family of unknown function (DUF6390)